MLSMDFSGGYSGFFFFFHLENMSDAIDVSSMISEIPLPNSFNFSSSIQDVYKKNHSAISLRCINY
jgi:hypothetical protein